MSTTKMTEKIHIVPPIGRTSTPVSDIDERETNGLKHMVQSMLCPTQIDKISMTPGLLEEKTPAKSKSAVSNMTDFLKIVRRWTESTLNDHCNTLYLLPEEFTIRVNDVDIRRPVYKAVMVGIQSIGDPAHGRTRVIILTNCYPRDAIKRVVDDEGSDHSDGAKLKTVSDREANAFTRRVLKWRPNPKLANLLLRGLETINDLSSPADISAEFVSLMWRVKAIFKEVKVLDVGGSKTNAMIDGACEVHLFHIPVLDPVTWRDVKLATRDLYYIDAENRPVADTETERVLVSEQHALTWSKQQSPLPDLLLRDRVSSTIHEKLHGANGPEHRNNLLSRENALRDLNVFVHANASARQKRLAVVPRLVKRTTDLQDLAAAAAPKAAPTASDELMDISHADGSPQLQPKKKSGSKAPAGSPPVAKVGVTSIALVLADGANPVGDQKKGKAKAKGKGKAYDNGDGDAEERETVTNRTMNEGGTHYMENGHWINVGEGVEAAELGKKLHKKRDNQARIECDKRHRELKDDLRNGVGVPAYMNTKCAGRLVKKTEKAPVVAPLEAEEEAGGEEEEEEGEEEEEEEEEEEGGAVEIVGSATSSDDDDDDEDEDEDEDDDEDEDEDSDEDSDDDSYTPVDGDVGGGDDDDEELPTTVPKRLQSGARKRKNIAIDDGDEDDEDDANSGIGGSDGDYSLRSTNRDSKKARKAHVQSCHGHVSTLMRHKNMGADTSIVQISRKLALVMSSVKPSHLDPLIVQTQAVAIAVLAKKCAQLLDGTSESEHIARASRTTALFGENVEKMFDVQQQLGNAHSHMHALGKLLQSASSTYNEVCTGWEKQADVLNNEVDGLRAT